MEEEKDEEEEEEGEEEDEVLSEPEGGEEEEEVEEEEEEVEEEEGVSMIYTPFITSLRELFTGALSDVLPYTQNEFFPSTSVPFQFSHTRSVSA